MTAILVVAASIHAGSVLAASQCDKTPWEQSNGRTCQSIGLDSNRAVCRDGDEFAMHCDDSQTQIRTCRSDRRCGGDDAACPGSIKREYGERGCDAYDDGYRFGRRDAEDKKRGDFERHDDRYSKGTEDAFKTGYNAAYRKYK